MSWLTQKDPNLLVIKRSVRAAVVQPSVFGFAHWAFSDSQVGLFAAFGSFAILLLVEFTGPPRTRLASYGGLYVVGSCFVALGTVLSTHEAAAVVAMGLVGFTVLFTGIVAPQLATASTAALLTFVLPVSVAQPAGAVGPRLVGWTLAAVCGVAASLLVWPPPWHDALRLRLAASVSALARLAESRAQGRADPEADAAVHEELAKLRTQFAATPYPPTGAASGAVALSKLVGRVQWVADNTATISQPQWSVDEQPALDVTERVAETLDRSAALICDADGHPVTDPVRVRALQEATRALDDTIVAALDADVASVASAEAEGPAAVAAVPDGTEVVTPDATDATDAMVPGDTQDVTGSLDPGFHARALGIATGIVADAALEAAGADVVVDRRLGMGEASSGPDFAHRILSHLSLRSVWFRNALRGGLGLAGAVAVIEVAGVQHGFWVVLGTLSVLRSNAMGTGASALRAVSGTAIGFFIGSAIMIGVADHTALLWVALPLAVLVSGIAPSMISFAAGQAAFTVLVIVLFNLIEPTGWRVGLTRIEDVAIGCAVSIVVGFLFWPRGAIAALGRALSDAFVASSAYLSDAVDHLTMWRSQVDTSASQQAAHRAYLLLDDTFRQYFAENGAKVVSVETVSRLFTGSNRLRLAAYTLASLSVHPPAAGLDEVAAVDMAETVLRDSYAASHRWYQEFADMLADRRQGVEEPAPSAEMLHDVLRRAFDEVRAHQRVDRLQTALQMLWADELLENQRQTRADLLASAGLFLRGKRRILV